MPMTDSLILEVADFEHDVLTGIYSEETGKPQPLRITISARLTIAEHYAPDTPLDASKNYMDLKFAASDAISNLLRQWLITSARPCLCRICGWRR
jgi:dihydroneopterin aldolase